MWLAAIAPGCDNDQPAPHNFTDGTGGGDETTLWSIAHGLAHAAVECRDGAGRSLLEIPNDRPMLAAIVRGAVLAGLAPR